jgi:hypothetical protein
MPSEAEKQRRKQLQQQLQAATKETFLAGLPVQLAMF